MDSDIIHKHVNALIAKEKVSNHVLLTNNSYFISTYAQVDNPTFRRARALLKYLRTDAKRHEPALQDLHFNSSTYQEAFRHATLALNRFHTLNKAAMQSLRRVLTHWISALDIGRFSPSA